MIQMTKKKLIVMIVVIITLVILTVSAIFYSTYQHDKKTYQKETAIKIKHQKEKQNSEEIKKENKKSNYIDSDGIQWLSLAKLNLTDEEIANLKTAVKNYNESADFYKIESVMPFSGVTQEQNVKRFQLKISSYNFYYTVNVSIDTQTHKVEVKYYKNKIDYQSKEEPVETDKNLQPD